MKAKKITILILTAILVTSSNFFVRSSNNDEGENKKIKKYINTRIIYPENDENLSGFVIVEYNIDKIGTVSVNAINASHSKLKDHVQNSINNLSNFPVAEVTDTTFICKYVFVSQKDYSAPQKSKGMKSIIGINDYTAENL